jgi:transcription elongation factor SPT5
VAGTSYSTVLIISRVLRFADFTMQRGLEEAAVWYILRHMEGLVDENSPMVKSAFARTIAPGYIFVEAPSVADVRRACEGFVGYQGRYKKICFVADDPASLLEYHPNPKVPANSWVRIKRGMYAGDLAFLCRVDVADLGDEQFRRTQGTAYLRVVPRIPLEAGVSLKRKFRGVRPSPQFFDPFCWPKEASKLPEKPEADGWVFRRGVFNSGLLDLEVPLNPLNLGRATPSRSELKLWGTCGDSNVQYFALKSLKALAEEFWVGDRAKVISGDWLGGVGVVSEVGDESVSIFLGKDILGDNGQQGPSSMEVMEVQLVPASIRKVFNVGDYVEAVVDDNRPRRGFVIAIHQTEGERDTVTITERGCQEVSVAPTRTVISDLT